MTWRVGQHRHIAVERILWNRRIELEVCDQVSRNPFVCRSALTRRRKVVFFGRKSFEKLIMFSLPKDITRNSHYSSSNSSSTTHALMHNEFLLARLLHLNASTRPAGPWAGPKSAPESAGTYCIFDNPEHACGARWDCETKCHLSWHARYPDMTGVPSTTR